MALPSSSHNRPIKSKASSSPLKPTTTPPSTRLFPSSPSTPEPFVTPWDKGYWTPQRRYHLKVLNYSLPVVVACGYALYLQLYDAGTRQRVTEREQDRERRRQLGQKDPPLNIVQVLTQKLPEDSSSTKQ